MNSGMNTQELKNYNKALGENKSFRNVMKTLIKAVDIEKLDETAISILEELGYVIKDNN